MNPRLRRRLRRWAAWGLFVFALALWGCNRWVVNSTDSYLYTDSALMPDNEVGLVLGCSPFASDGRASQEFRGRIRAAADLYHVGKVKRLILSGANPDAHYNEPKKMRDALMERGIPSDAMTLDYAGDSTFDSVARSSIVFDLTRITIITQRYHAWRALFLARKMGMSAVGFAAPIGDSKPGDGFRHPPREVLARMLAVLDIFVLRTEPRDTSPPRESADTP